MTGCDRTSSPVPAIDVTAFPIPPFCRLRDLRLARSRMNQREFLRGDYDGVLMSRRGGMRSRKWPDEVKARIVAEDERETSGARALLNLGHTFGHALEAVSRYGKYLHGEAISIGQVAAAKISRDVLGLGQAEVDRIEALFAQANLPTSVRLAKRLTLRKVAWPSRAANTKSASTSGAGGARCGPRSVRSIRTTRSSN